MSAHGKGGLRESLYKGGGGELKKYSRLMVGKPGILSLIGFELRTVLLENIPGAPGIFFRRLFYRGLFRNMGRNVFLGKGITLRHPSKISIGDNVAIDDYCTLDARGGDSSGISIGSDTVISRGAILRTKDGTIVLGKGCGIGSNCILASTSKLEIGDNLLMASCVCAIAGGQHAFDRVDVPIVEQGMVSRGGVSIGRDVWIGTRATILDGTSIGDNAIIGACALVNKDIPAYAIAYGIPAKPVRDRRNAVSRFS